MTAFQVNDIVTPVGEHDYAEWPCRVMRVREETYGTFVDVSPLSNHPMPGFGMAEEGFRHRPDLVANLHPSWLVMPEPWK